MASPARPSPLVFVGDSRMATLMRAFDWSATPIGPPSTWPQTLQTVVRVILTSRYAMWMGWGAELTFFYNDAYATMTLGAKHPWALGRPSREVWAEIWPQIGPRIDKVLRTGEATWDEALLLFLERSGYPEETYHTFSYSPLADDVGVIRGHLCVVTEDTDRVIGERRLALLRDVSGAIAATNSESELWPALEKALQAPLPSAGPAGTPDLPFTLTYLFEGGSSIARCVARTGIAGSHPAAPDTFDTRDTRAPWPIAEAIAEGRGVRLPLAGRLADLPRGPWDRPPTQALLLPIAQQGQATPAGVFVAGINPFRPLDDPFRSFVGLLAGQVAAGLSNARTYEAERHRAEALAEIDRAKTAFFSNVSHEFRTPLTLLLGPLEDALSAPVPALSGPDLETAYRNALRLLKLVNALLDFARIEAGRVQAGFEPTDLAAATRDVASVFQSAIERAGLGFVVDCEPIPGPILVDRDMWEKVVLNLLSNAFKFTFEGEIRVTLRPTAEGAELTVADTGIGVAPDELPRLFERFHRIEGARARTHEGSGIGLALVQELVRIHGGSITAESAPGRGTRFSVRLRGGSEHLPAERIGAPSRGASAATARAFAEEVRGWLSPGRLEPEPRKAAALAGRRIVIADDNADMREYVSRLLGTTCEVEAVSNGAQALEALRRRPADLLLTDVMMPVLDGFSLLRAVRADPALAELPVVMLSARSGEEARVEGLEAGADDYLIKPFSARELTARVVSHLELARARRQAATERDRFRALLAQVPAIVNFLRGPDLVFEFAHPLAVAAAGGRPLLGRPLLEAMPEHREQPFADLLRSVYATGEPISGHEVPVRLDRSGTGVLEDSFWNYRYLPVRTATGEVEGVMTFDLDVTAQVLARRRLEEQTAALRAAREAAEVATRAKDEFLAILGHELRNPLAPILTALQLLKLRGQQSTEQEIIERQVRHLMRLVDDLLDVARITQGKIALQLRPVELSRVVARALELVSPLIEERQHTIDVDVPAERLTVQADPDRLAQVVTNLLTNAAKYSDPGSRIALRARRAGDRVELAVRDEGVGIAPEMLTHVFEPFVQQTQTLERSRGGLGLGLTIVRTLVEKHGGTVSAHSAGRGLGSEFVVALPPAAAAGEAGQHPLPRPPSAGARQRVLLVDDNADALETLRVALEHLGHEVTVAGDGPSALEAWRRFHPQIAVLDLGLPVMDGYELAGLMRAGSPEAATPRLIALSGYGQHADRERARAAGFERHLVKPVDLDRLRQVVEEAREPASDAPAGPGASAGRAQRAPGERA